MTDIENDMMTDDLRDDDVMTVLQWWRPPLLSSSQIIDIIGSVMTVDIDLFGNRYWNDVLFNDETDQWWLVLSIDRGYWDPMKKY